MPPKITKLYWLSIHLSLFNDPRICMLRSEFNGDGGLIAFQYLGYAGDCDSNGLLITGDSPTTPEAFALKCGHSAELCRKVFSRLVEVGWASFNDGVYGVEKALWAEVCRYDNVLKSGRNRTEKSRAGENEDNPVEADANDENTALDITPQTPPTSKKEKTPKQVSAEAQRLAELLATQIRGYIPDFIELKDSKREKTVRSYAQIFDLMITRDERTAADIERVIMFATGDTTPQANGFCWARNILSAASLRKQFEKLRVQMGPTSNAGKPTILNNNPAAMARSIGI